MYDAGKVITGLIVFFLLVTFPIWISVGEDAKMPKLAKASGETCVESAEYMRANHMQLLDDWRHAVVRDNDRVYVSHAYGTKFDKSLSSDGKKSCMSCHANKKEFCDACHDYSSVKPYCWTCHLEPKEEI